MRTLTWEEAADWANRVGLNASVRRVDQEFLINGETVRSQRIENSVRYADEGPEVRITLALPKLPYQVTYLANSLLPYSEAAELQSCLLWITDWGIWSDVSERVANSLVECFRKMRGEAKPLIERPAHLFDSTEATDAQTLLTIAVVFGWDCYVIPEDGEYYALTSHDEYLEVVSRTSAVHHRMVHELERWRS